MRVKSRLPETLLLLLLLYEMEDGRCSKVDIIDAPDEKSWKPEQSQSGRGEDGGYRCQRIYDVLHMKKRIGEMVREPEMTSGSRRKAGPCRENERYQNFKPVHTGAFSLDKDRLYQSCPSPTKPPTIPTCTTTSSLSRTEESSVELGTGTGRWAADFAFPPLPLWPRTSLPLEPAANVAHANYDFMPALYGETPKALKPGGWFEQAGISVVAVSDGGYLHGQMGCSGAELGGTRYRAGETGFVDVSGRSVNGRRRESHRMGKRGCPLLYSANAGRGIGLSALSSFLLCTPGSSDSGCARDESCATAYDGTCTTQDSCVSTCVSGSSSLYYLLRG
ncbi:hypothetical protein McanMca71_002569 [Microsporum canis]